jgi:phenylpyruvate tautomerase PptA (4-oxalocrotonate tautomerase family)
MPFARIDILAGKSAAYKQTLSSVVHDAIVTVLAAPSDDRFQVITEHAAEDHIFSPSYLGITHTANIVFIHLTLNVGRLVETKKAFYKAVADGLHAQLGLRREDVFIYLTDVPKENWSFGNGEAQYA